MLLNIEHHTDYHYEEAVFLEPHYFYLKPQSRPHLDLKSFEVKVKPNPTGISERLDAENNAYIQTWLNDKTDHFNVTTLVALELREHNQFNFLLDPVINLGEKQIYNDGEMNFLKPYLQFEDKKEVNQFARQFAEAKNYDPISFMTSIVEEISEKWDHTVRMEQNILPIEKCFKEQKGSCRDLAIMLINMLRSMGLASRFVSGYAYNPDLGDGHELHAWVDVLLPGAGWVGLDPSLGLFTNKTYIPLATSYTPETTMPVKGTYRGNVKSSLDTQVKITQA